MTDMQNLALRGDEAASGLRNQNGQRVGSKGLRTRRKLVEKTLELLESRGLRDLTVTEVARAAGTSPATFYVYFEGVPEVVLAALQEIDQTSPELFAFADNDWQGSDGEQQARRFVDEYCRLWNRHRVVYRVRNMAAEEGDRRFYDARLQSARPIIEALAAKMDRAKDQGRAPGHLDSYAIAAAIITMLERMSAVGPTTADDKRISYQALKDSAAHMISLTYGA